jgi:hypothetical protein
MAIIYYDREVLSSSDTRHPALEVNEIHPCYKMVREAIDKKSVFHWTKVQANSMYEWYVDGYKVMEVNDEFGMRVDRYDFQDIIKSSYYIEEMKKGKPVVSEFNIEDTVAAIKMERKILESNGDVDEADD